MVFLIWAESLPETGGLFLCRALQRQSCVFTVTNPHITGWKSHSGGSHYILPIRSANIVIPFPDIIQSIIAMKRNKVWVFCLSLALLTACKKSDKPGTDNPRPEPPKPAGVVTPVGAPDQSAPATATIGATGGQLFSTNGTLKVIVPAGAFTTDQQVTIQQISNNCPGSHGTAYRILPEGITFAKPVTLQFRFNMSDSVKMAPTLATAAYQNSKGVWMAMPKAVVDAEARTVVIETTHFSDWTVISGVMMSASPGVVTPGGKSRLIVYYAEDLLAPLVKEERPIPGFIEIPGERVKNWQVDGPGSIAGQGGKADYTAPPIDLNEATQTAVVSARVEVGEGKHVTLLTPLVIAHGYISFRINNGPTEYVHRGVAQRMQYPHPFGQGEKYTAIYGNATPSTASAPVWIEWDGQQGMWPFKYQMPGITRMHFRHNGKTYASTYTTHQGSSEVLISPGYIKITRMDNDYMHGEFEIEKAGEAADVHNAWKTVYIKGYFKVPKRLDPANPIPF